MSGSHAPGFPDGWQYMPPPGIPPRKKRRIGLWITLAIVALVVVSCVSLGVAAFNTDTATRTNGTPVPTIGTGRSGAPAAPSASAAEPTPETNDEVGTIGADAFTYDDGTVVSVLSAKRVTFSDSATSAGKTGVAVTVQIKNGSTERLDVSLCQVSLTYGDAGETSEDVYDSARGLTGGFESGLPAGRTATAQYGFLLPRAATKIRVDVTPTFDHSASSFEGSVK